MPSASLLFYILKLLTGNVRFLTVRPCNCLSRTTSAKTFYAVTYGNGKWVALANTNVGITSSDGFTWTQFSTPADNLWASVVYGNGKFVAVAQQYSTSGTCGGITVGKCAMTSTDGASWTLRSTPSDNKWESLAFGVNRYFAVSLSGAGSCGGTTSGKCAMTSADGITWEILNTPADIDWSGVTFGNDKYVAVAHALSSGQAVFTTTIGCTSCAAGFFSAGVDVAGSSACTACPSGLVSGTGYASCLSSCPAGMIHPLF